MRKIMFAMIGLIFMVLSLTSAMGQTQDCVDCCNGGPCTGQEADSQALDVTDCLVRINDRVVKNDVTVLKAFERGQELDINIEFVSAQDADNVQVAAFITGYHRGAKMTDSVFDITPTFNVEANVSYEKTLTLQLPSDFKVTDGDELKIRVEISDKFSGSYIREYNLKIEAPSHNIVLQDILLDPDGTVEAGRGVFASVRLKNMGEDDEESIKVTASIPALGVKATEYIDELKSDEATTTEDMFLRIPVCANAGTYTVKAVVTYSDGDEEVSDETPIAVTASNACQANSGNEQPSNGGTTTDKTVVTVPGSQDVITGSAGTVYPIIIQNNGATDRSYTLTATGLEGWATTRFDPGSLVVIPSKQTQTVYLHITPTAAATAGQKVFMVNIQTDNDNKQIALTANVVEGQTQSPFNLNELKQPLVIGLIVLAVLVVILLLVLGFSRMKGGGEEPEEVSGQTYY